MEKGCGWNEHESGKRRENSTHCINGGAWDGFAAALYSISRRHFGSFNCRAGGSKHLFNSRAKWYGCNPNTTNGNIVNKPNVGLRDIANKLNVANGLA